MARSQTPQRPSPEEQNLQKNLNHLNTHENNQAKNEAKAARKNRQNLEIESERQSNGLAGDPTHEEHVFPDQEYMPSIPRPYDPHPPFSPAQYRAFRHSRYIRGKMRRAYYQTRHRTRKTVFVSIMGTAIPIFSLAILIGGIIGTAFFYYVSQKPALDNLATQFPGDSLKIYDANNTLVDELTDEGTRTTIPLNQMSLDIIHATIAIEDKDFWTNQGVDFMAVVRATSDDLRYGQIVSGASTITQQLIKRGILGSQVTYDRKLREMILAIGLTHQMSKEDILKLYLNTIFYGEQAYGIDAAAQTYFGLQDQPGKSAAAQLDLAQASMLAGLPQSPSQLDPLTNRQAALDRQKQVLAQMVTQGYITEQDARQAENESQSPDFFKSANKLPDLAPHYSQYVLQELQTLINNHLVSTRDISRSGFSIHTTLNLPLQNQIQQEAQQHIAAMAYHNMTNAAVVGIDYHTGAIFTLLGSIDYNDLSIDGQFDVATQGYRQPGSSFKPFVYATAFEEGWSPGTPISDTAINIGGYAPKDYDNTFWGLLTVRQALQNSRNTPAVRTLAYAGIDQSLHTAQDMGITSYDGVPGYSMVLGGLGTHLLDETSAYGVFANGGVRQAPYTIESITDSSGKVIYQHQATPKQVISPQVAGLITNVLSDDGSRLREFGSCSPLTLYNTLPYSASCRGPLRPAAAKTGTTDDFKDNLTLGYTTDYVIGVWTGNNDGSPMYNVSGIDGAAPIWHDAMLLAEQGKPIHGFTLPHGLVRATVHYPGLTSTDWYLPGTVPAGGIILGQS